jgi:peptide/nickel transport system substrate-binding protein
VRARRLLILLLVCMVLALTACNSEEPGPEPTVSTSSEKDRVIKVAYSGIISRFDPTVQYGLAEMICETQVYDTLISKSFEGEFTPRLAERWDISDDNQVYTFYLREGVKWSDGKPFTAEDVVFSLDYYKNSSLMGWIYKDCESFEAVNDHTFRMTMNVPNATILSYLSYEAYAPIIPKHGIETYGENYGTSPETIIGTGPYEVVEFNHDVSITFKAKEDYWGGPVELKHVVLEKITDTNTAIVALQTGEIDIYFVPLSGEAYERLKDSEHLTFSQYTIPRHEGVFMYCRSGTFADVRMRRAVAHAISKEDLLMIGMDGLGTLINYPGDIGPSMTANPMYQPETIYEYDLERARALVEECGMVGHPVVVKSYNTDPYASQAVQIQSVLMSIGLDAMVQPMERSAFLEAMNKEECEIFPFSWNATTYDMDEALGSALHSQNPGSRGNYSFYVNTELDPLIEAARATADIEERKELYRQVIDVFMEEVPFVSTYAPTSTIARNARLSVDNPKSYRLCDYYWVD